MGDEEIFLDLSIGEPPSANSYTTTRRHDYVNSGSFQQKKTATEGCQETLNRSSISFRFRQSGSQRLSSE
jgi:hypothetical protein